MLKMEKSWKVIRLCVYVLGVPCLLIIYSFLHCNSNELKPIDTKENTEKIEKTQKTYPTYYDDDLRTVWPFNISKNYDQSSLREWNEPNQPKVVNASGYGEGGTAFVPPRELEESMNELYKQHNYNVLASDMISLHRSLPDSRSDECKRLSYPEKLPTTSVIIIFHNEGWSTLLRTVWSVINRSPPELLKEIILVDDFSTWPFLKRPLEDYVNLLPSSVKLIRTTKREGAIRGRLIGAQHATANVVTFLDSHTECNTGWLQPLLARIASDRSIVAVPLIESISSADMRYYSNEIRINGFRWSLLFNWMPVPIRERMRTQFDNTAPLRTPTMIGCGFALDREFFFEIGSFDEGMDIWGPESLELALRVWQCGGFMEVIPCSRVGHLYRTSTYSFDGDKREIMARNNIRLIQVWMNNAVNKLYFAAHPAYKNLYAGDVSDRMKLKKRLQCKSFEWYLEHIYPESNLIKEFVGIGQFKSVSKNTCMDIAGMTEQPLILYPCHAYGGSQIFAYSTNHTIVTYEEHCVGANKELNDIISVKCLEADPLQLWKYKEEKKWLIHTSGLCMKANNDKIELGNCEETDVDLMWDFNSAL